MKRIIYLIDSKINLITILFLFWTFFWGLNGFDKFFNGTSQVIKEQWASQGFLVDKEKNVVYSIQPSERVGWYGVNRDAKFANYFRTLHLPPLVSSISLYFFAVLEIILAILFFWLFIRQFFDNKDEETEGRKNLISDRTIHRLIFKASIWIFIAFITGDILFGDRAEVWEHGTFLIMTLVTYDLWYRTDQFFIEMKKQKRSGYDDGEISLQAIVYNLKVE
ncbi:MAG: hypothetical protein M3Q33_11090 [Acidobacteriota bacterium]|nr:hypothetical protein [Acidobacteriota bacterium]